MSGDVSELRRRHDEAVMHIAGRVQEFHKRHQPFRIYHGSTNSTRAPQYERDKIIDTSKLTNILEINKEMKTALVEPNVSMEALVTATLQHKLLPSVVMEFKGITVGGGFSGTSGESSSFRHGLFDSIVNWIEIVLADGTVTVASEMQNSDLLRSAPGAFGTLGVVTMLKVQLVDAKEFVELKYYCISSFQQAKEKIEALMSNEKVDFIDGIMFQKHKGVVMAGRCTDGSDVKDTPKVQHFTRRGDPWCYTHAQNLLRKNFKSNSTVVELVPITDYFFRYDRGGFWVAKYAFDYFLVPFNRITRWVLEYFMHTSIMCHALHESGLAATHIVQDIGIPLCNSDKFFEYLDRSVGIYPIWLCPIRRHYREELPLTVDTRLEIEEDYFLNFGIWGPCNRAAKRFEEINRDIERETKALAGIKCMYARTYYTEDEFWEIYDRERYEALRLKYKATTLPNIYDKVKNSPTRQPKRRLRSIRPFGGLWGVFRALTGSDYLLQN